MEPFSDSIIYAHRRLPEAPTKARQIIRAILPGVLRDLFELLVVTGSTAGTV
jgi:hypothetical protein